MKQDTRKPIRIDLPFDEAIAKALQVPEWPESRRGKAKRVMKAKRAKRPARPNAHR
jgi:hypothetical protein